MSVPEPATTNASTDRVLRALAFERPDVIPTYESYWDEFVDSWRQAKGLGPDTHAEGSVPKDWDIVDYYGVDVGVASADETLWPSRIEELEPIGNYTRQRDGWGRVVREREGAQFSIIESTGMAEADRDVDALDFEPADQSSRYTAFEAKVAVERERRCVFAKVGGPFLRLSYLRGMEQWLMELAAEPDFARALVARMADHQIAIGLESLRRGTLWNTGIWIFDDMCSHINPMFSPRTFEDVFMPSYSRMIDAFKSAGARHVCLHCDGNLAPLLPLLIDAGIDAIQPVQYSSGMVINTLKKQYGEQLAYIGGVDNVQTLPSGTDAEARRHFAELVEWAHEGGVILGSHSIGPDISVERYDAYHAAIRPEWEFPE